VPAPIISVQLAQGIAWSGGHPADGLRLSQ
jgi:hypothetical protein